MWCVWVYNYTAHNSKKRSWFVPRAREMRDRGVYFAPWCVSVSWKVSDLVLRLGPSFRVQWHPKKGTLSCLVGLPRFLFPASRIHDLEFTKNKPKQKGHPYLHVSFPAFHASCSSSPLTKRYKSANGRQCSTTKKHYSCTGSILLHCGRCDILRSNQS